MLAISPAPVAADLVVFDLEGLTRDARAYAERSRSANTRRSYAQNWAHFQVWCELRGATAMPAAVDALTLYIADLAGRTKPTGGFAYSVGTIQRRLVAIAQAHAAKEEASPTKSETVRRVWAGIRRTRGVVEVQKAAIRTDHIRLIADVLSDDIRGVRDRAMLLVGYAGAFRRSELVGLDLADVEFQAEGAVVTLRRSKTDQEGVGMRKVIPFGSNPATCPVRSLTAWIAAAAVTEGALFLSVDRQGRLTRSRASDRAVARAVKRYAAAIGLDPTQFSGHSLRAGFVTEADANGARNSDLKKQTGHRSDRMLDRYKRDNDLWRHPAAALLGL
jgi:site-specific recombinase XerD